MPDHRSTTIYSAWRACRRPAWACHSVQARPAGRPMPPRPCPTPRPNTCRAGAGSTSSTSSWSTARSRSTSATSPTSPSWVSISCRLPLDYRCWTEPDQPALLQRAGPQADRPGRRLRQEACHSRSDQLPPGSRVHRGQARRAEVDLERSGDAGVCARPLVGLCRCGIKDGPTTR